MLRILGSKKRLCDGLTRRDWLHIGGLGLLGMGAEDIFRLQAAEGSPLPEAAADASFGKAKSCILLLPYGSPPQHETFDPKPDAPSEIRGEFKSIPTKLPGVHVDEHMPKIAQIMDRITVVRSMTHPFPVHCTAYVVSGIPDYSPALESRPRDPKLWPFIGSAVDYLDELASSGQSPPVPRNIALPWKMNSRGGPQAAAVQTGPYAAFLGPAYDPVLTDFQGEGTREVIRYNGDGGPRHMVADPYAGITPQAQFTIAGARLPKHITLDRYNRRRSLLAQLDESRRSIDSNASTDSFDRFQQMAFNLVAQGNVQKALHVQAEKDSMRDSYGMTLFGQSCLAARRLVEAGSRFVTVFWDEFAYLNTGWDTHWNHFYRLKDHLLPGFDSAFSGLILDLESRGMLDETLVVWMSEHGRTPKINAAKGGGRDHYSRVYSIALAGGGIARGNVVGESDRIGGDVLSTPVSPKDILATMLHLLGISSESTAPDQLGRPHRIAGTGKIRPELLS
ncbi:DUF1501 domain-containing protein [Pirellulales bacterium]|nr:DUF1501 domain-containing protein [Pirellulales bacterium]